ncbi:hypothetical protein [Rhodopila sp.]|jgi:hypothetical protein|nr:hypothetical protein [Rhodopila sp.]HVZ10462.1 hypothetical protein [Rhodopila sp.]
MPPRRKPRPKLPPEIPETAKPDVPKPPDCVADDLPDELRKMLEAAYT